MARYEYGQSADSTVAEPVGDALTLADGLTVTFWSAVTGGTQYTSFVSATDGVTVVGPSFVIDETGILPRFLGPDGVAFMWLSGVGGTRVRVPGQWVPGGVVAATETTAGIARRATTAEASAAINDTAYLSPLKLALTTIFRRVKGDSVSLAGNADTAVTYTVTDDGTAQAAWPNRWIMKFGTALTGYANKYGELRSDAALASTVAFRARNRNANPTANIIEAGIAETDVLFGVGPTGAVVAPNIGAKVVVLGVNDPVPEGTPDRSLIVRLTTASSGGGGGSTSSLLTDHLHEGTVGSSPTAAQEGYASSSGPLPVYVAGGIVGATALRWAGANAAGQYVDTFPQQTVDLHVRWYFRWTTYSAVAIFFKAYAGATDLLSIRLRTADITLLEALNSSSNGATPITRPATNTWVRMELVIGTASATMSMWNTPASTGAANATMTVTFTAPIARPTSIQIGQTTTSNSDIDIDALAVGTAPIGPAT